MNTSENTTSKEICPATTGEVCLHYTGHIFDVQTQIERIQRISLYLITLAQLLGHHSQSPQSVFNSHIRVTSFQVTS